MASAGDETGRTFAVGSDSDFFIFERCRYIHFDDLRVRGHVCARVRLYDRTWAERCSRWEGRGKQQGVGGVSRSFQAPHACSNGK